MSNSLVKIFEYSIFPSVMLILGKLMGVFIVIWIEDLPWSFRDYSNNLFKSGTGIRPEDIRLVTTYSDLVMYVAIASFFSLHLFRTIFFNSANVKPTLVASLASKNLMKLIQSSYEAYHSAATNLLFLWLATIFILSNVLLENTSLLVGAVALLSSIILTTLLLHDVHKELENIKHNPGSYQWS